MRMRALLPTSWPVLANSDFITLGSALQVCAILLIARAIDTPPPKDILPVQAPRLARLTRDPASPRAAAHGSCALAKPWRTFGTTTPQASSRV